MRIIFLRNTSLVNWVVLSACLVGLATVWGQNTQTRPSRPLLDRVPEDWRAEVSQLEMTESEQREYLPLPDAQLQYRLLEALMFLPPATDFVLDHLDKLQLGDEIDLLNLMPEFEHWVKSRRTLNMLNNLTESKSDPRLVKAAFRTLVLFQTHRERLFIEQELTGASGQRREELASEDEYLMDAEKGAVVPAYLRQIPAAFAARPASESIRVLAFGDFGTGGPAQKQVAAAMFQYHQHHAFDFGITMGDNFTPAGMDSPTDPRWQSRWEDLYGPMKINFYPSFGNHDWSSPDSPAAELSYRSQAGNWIMPSPYYTFTAGPAQFFAIDTGTTGEMSLTQLQWLKVQLDKSQSRWKIVYGHHCPYFAGGENSIVVNELMPILQRRADVYLAGHYHSLQHLNAVDGVSFYISAGGGRPLYPIDASEPRGIFAKSVYGFAVIDIDEHTFRLRFVGEDGAILDESVIQK